MQRSEPRTRSSLQLDLRPPQRLDPWAMTLAISIALATNVPPLIGLFYAGGVPAALAKRLFPEERWPVWAALLVAWTAAWLTLAAIA